MSHEHSQSGSASGEVRPPRGIAHGIAALTAIVLAVAALLGAITAVVTAYDALEKAVKGLESSTIAEATAQKAAQTATEAQNLSRTVFERPVATWTLQKHDQPLEPTAEWPEIARVQFDHNACVGYGAGAFDSQIPYQDGEFTIPVSGIYILTTSVYISTTSKRRLDVHVDRQMAADEQFVLGQSQVDAENQYNSTLAGSIAFGAKRGDKVSIWAGKAGPGVMADATANSTWVTLSLINEERPAQAELSPP